MNNDPLDPLEPKKNPLVVPELTAIQKDLIEKNWRMNLVDLTKLVFDDQAVDGRSIKCRVVKMHIAELGTKPSPDQIKKPKISALLSAPHLTNVQKEYIKNHMDNSSNIEMAIVLFGKPNLLMNSVECRMVTDYCRELNPSYRRGEELVEGPYKIPADLNELLEKVNRYAINPRKDGRPIFDASNLSNNDKKQLNALLGYMKLPLFVSEGNKYSRQDDRELYESTFMAVCWDKPDLLSEEVIQYIALAAETVKYTMIERTVNKLDDRMNATLETPGAQLKMAEVELLNAVREKSNASMSQSAKLLKTLVGDRAKRLNDKIQASASMHNLVESWKREDDRRRIIQMNERKQKLALKAEVERLSDMDALKVEIFGLDKENILL